MSLASRLPRFYDGWVVVAVTALVLLVTAGTRTAPGAFLLAADTFGRRNLGVVYGWIFASHMIGAAIAAFAAGATRDLVGDYGIAFIVAGGMAAAAGVVALSIRGREAVGVAAVS